MATRSEHYKEAEKLIAEATDALGEEVGGVTELIALAQVHATLALVPVSLSVRDA